MKLIERDRRPKHTFEVGDIVEYHGSYKQAPGGKGIILDIKYEEDDTSDPRLQCVFFPRDVDLFKTMRTYSANKALNQTHTQGFEVSARALSFVEKAPESWFNKVTAQDIANLRFTHILDIE